MAHFKVKAATPEGRIVVRSLDAASRHDLAEMLERDGLFLIEASGGGTGLFSFLFKGRRSVNPSEFLTFNQGFIALLKAGLPVTECLDGLVDGSMNADFVAAVDRTVAEVKSGKSLSEAMKFSPGVFPHIYVASIGAGELTGDLVPVLKSFIEYQRRSEEIRKQVVSAAIYPMVLTALACVVVLFLITYVVPSFAAIYKDMGQELPLPTRVLIHFTDLVGDNFVLSAIVAATGVFSFNYFISTAAGAAYLDRLKLEAPRFGAIYKEYAVSKFSRTLAMVLTSGMPLIQALEMSMEVLDNSVLEGKLRRIIGRAREGETVTSAMADEEFMPPVSLRMFSVGEQSASLQEMLTDIADFHDDEVSHKVKVLTDLLEPALMVIMGLIIGTIVVLIYLPIFMLGENY